MHRGTIRFLWGWGTAILVAAAVSTHGREVISLDGAWSFATNEEGEGGRSIQVPGAWDAQGVGGETDKLRHHHVGKGWYRKEIRIPEAWQGKRIFLCVGAVHRYARVWIEKHYLGEHIGYLSSFEHELTAHVAPGKAAAITICVDSEQRWDVDCLTGCVDIIDSMFTVWGGIWGHVWLEARSDAWLEELAMRTALAPAVKCGAEARVAGTRPAGAHVRLEVEGPGGGVAATKTAPLEAALKPNGAVAVEIELPGARLWSPAQPALYTARLAMVANGTVLDEVATRFGIRDLAIRGSAFLLNGKRIFLAGYGDDAIYPETMAPPADKRYYLDRLSKIKEYGFNHVRHHSHILPPEYYDACDEAGMLVSAEFPIAYAEYYARAKGPALALYETEWAAAIARLRNHPSILDWCMANEMWDSFPLAPRLYEIAKGLDPGRAVIDSDGLFAQAGFQDGARDRPTLDFYMVMFDIFNLPLDVPDKYRFKAKPAKPVLSHEAGNFATFPRLDMIPLFKHNFKPFWLAPAEAKLRATGLLGEVERWACNSERLYHLCHKIDLEALRKNPEISGHHWWLFQDYWTGSNGLVDTYFRPKAIAPEEVRAIIGEIVLLQDGLPLTCRSGDRLAASLLVSNFSPEELKGPVLASEFRSGETVVARREDRASVGQGRVEKVATIEATAPNVAAPKRLGLSVSLRSGDRRYRNAWSTWVFPEVRRASTTIPIYACPSLLPVAARFGALPLPTSDGPLPSPAVYMVGDLDRRTIDAAQAGSCVVCVSPTGLFPAQHSRFKTAWWLGSENDSNVGTVAYDNPITRDMAPDGWCDAGWYRLIEGGQSFLVDEMPAPPQILVRALDVHTLCRNKALLFQAKVGAGSMIVSGFNLRLGLPFEEYEIHPETEWLLGQLARHAGTAPASTATIDPAYLRDRVPATRSAIEGPFATGFARLVANEGEHEPSYESYRAAPAPLDVCRQTAPGHAVTWETAPVAATPSPPGARAVTFVFAGGLGWITEPERRGFSLSIDGVETIDLDVVQSTRTWTSADGAVTLTFVARKLFGPDTMGLFCLTVPASRLTAGRPVRLSVASRSSESRRWFGLNPFADVVKRPAAGR